jgi:hypothetical protein
LQALKAGHLTDRGFLMENPRSLNWMQALNQDLKHSLGTSIAAQIPQALNVAFAHHEIVADVMPSVFKFFRGEKL